MSFINLLRTKYRTNFQENYILTNARFDITNIDTLVYDTLFTDIEGNVSDSGILPKKAISVTLNKDLINPIGNQYALYTVDGNIFSMNTNWGSNIEISFYITSEINDILKNATGSTQSSDVVAFCSEWGQNNLIFTWEDGTTEEEKITNLQTYFETGGPFVTFLSIIVLSLIQSRISISYTTQLDTNSFLVTIQRKDNNAIIKNISMTTENNKDGDQYSDSYDSFTDDEKLMINKFTEEPLDNFPIYISIQKQEQQEE